MIRKLFVSVAMIAFAVASPSLAGPGGLGERSALSGSDAGNLLLPDPANQECGPASPVPCPTSDGVTEAPQGRGTEATASPGSGKSPSKLLSAGSPSVAFTLQDLEGKPFVFAPGSRSKPLLVIFWSLFCEPCKEEFPMYGWLSEQYGPKGLDAVAVNIDGPTMAAAAKRYLKMSGVSLPVVMDRKEGKRIVTAEAYGVTGTPSLFLIDKAGTVRWSHSGRVSAKQIEAVIRETLGS